MMIIDEWLEDRLYMLVPAENPNDFAMLAGTLRAEALATGYRLHDLEEACGGDIAEFLMKWQANASPVALAANKPSSICVNDV